MQAVPQGGHEAVSEGRQVLFGQMRNRPKVLCARPARTGQEKVSGYGSSYGKTKARDITELWKSVQSTSIWLKE